MNAYGYVRETGALCGEELLPVGKQRLDLASFWSAHLAPLGCQPLQVVEDPGELATCTLKLRPGGLGLLARLERHDVLLCCSATLLGFGLSDVAETLGLLNRRRALVYLLDCLPAEAPDSGALLLRAHEVLHKVRSAAAAHLLHGAPRPARRHGQTEEVMGATEYDVALFIHSAMGPPLRWGWRKIQKYLNRAGIGNRRWGKGTLQQVAALVTREDKRGAKE